MNTISSTTSLWSQLSSSSLYQTQQKKSPSETDPLASLVESGVITEEQQDAVKDALDASAEFSFMPIQVQAPQDPMSQTLTELVDSGAITSDQASSVQAALDEAISSAQASGISLSDDDFSSLLDDLVADGTITSDQEEAITTTLEDAKKNAPPPPPMPPELIDSLNSLVDSETITEDQLDSIIGVLESHNDSDNPLQTLVDEGVLTSDEKDSVLSALQNATNYKKAQEAYSVTTALDSLVNFGTIDEEQENSIFAALM